MTVAFGTNNARTAPTIRPVKIRRIRLLLLYFATIFLNRFISFLLFFFSSTIISVPELSVNTIFFQ